MYSFCDISAPGRIYISLRYATIEKKWQYLCMAVVRSYEEPIMHNRQWYCKKKNDSRRMLRQYILRKIGDFV